MPNIDEGKLQAIAEAESWLRQARMYYQAWRYEIGDDAIKRARVVLDGECFQRKPIPGMGRELPETVKVKAPHLPQGFMVVNGVDFNPETMELFEEPRITKKRS